MQRIEPSHPGLILSGRCLPITTSYDQQRIFSLVPRENVRPIGAGGSSVMARRLLPPRSYSRPAKKRCHMPIILWLLGVPFSSHLMLWLFGVVHF